MTEILMTETEGVWFLFWSFENSIFGFVSNFGFRASNLSVLPLSGAVLGEPPVPHQYMRFGKNSTIWGKIVIRMIPATMATRNGRIPRKIRSRGTPPTAPWETP